MFRLFAKKEMHAMYEYMRATLVLPLRNTPINYYTIISVIDLKSLALRGVIYVCLVGIYYREKVSYTTQ